MAGDIDRLREVSRAAFGQTYRLEIMLAISKSSDGIVCLTDLAAELGISASNAQGSLRSLLETGLLTELPRGDGKRRFLLRNRSAAWGWATELANFADYDEGSADRFVTAARSSAD